MATSISINTIPDTDTGRDDFFNKPTDGDVFLTNNLIRASTMRRILKAQSLGNIFASSSIPFSKLTGSIADTQISTKTIYGSSPPSGKVQHINDRTIGPINLTHGIINWSATAVGINVEASTTATLNVAGTFRSRDATFVGSGSTTEGGQITLMDPSGAGGWEIDNLSQTLRFFRDKGVNNTAEPISISNTGVVTVGAVNVSSVAPRSAGSSSSTSYRFHNGTNILTNAGFYYNTSDSAVNLAIGGSDIVSVRADSVRFNQQTITTNRRGNRLVNENTGVFNEIDGSGTSVRFKLQIATESSGLSDTVARTAMTVNPSNGFVGIGADADASTTDAARLNVAGNIRSSGTILASNIKLGSVTIDNSSSTVTFNGGATFGGTVSVSTPTADGHAATKSYVDSKVPVIPDLSSTYLPLAGGTTTGNINVGGTVSPAVGRVNLSVGTATQAGYVEIRKADNTRIGYMGWDNTTMNIECEGASPNRALRVAAADGLRCTGNVTAFFSDERLKTFLGKIPNALDKVNSVSGYYFKENEKAKSLGYSNDKIQVGVNAQEVERVLPEVISLAPIDTEVNERGEVVSKSGENIKTVSYEKLVPVLIEAIKELSNKVSYLESKLNN